MALLTEVYFIVGKLSLQLASFHPSASPVWPPAGMALAILLLLGKKYWPVVAVGAFFVNVTTKDSSLVSPAIIAIGNTLEALVSCYFAQSIAGGGKMFERVYGVLAFSIVVAVIGPLVAASFGALALVVDGLLLRQDVPIVWFTWWLGDFVGMMTITPLAMLWATSSHKQCGPVKLAEALLVVLLILGISLLVFGSFQYPLGFLCVLPIIWTALRFAPRDTALCVILVSIPAIAGTLRGWGAFVASSENESLLFLQSFLAVCSFIGLVLSAAILERRLAVRSLEDAVAERTQELVQALAQDRANAERLAHIVNHMTVATIAVDERLKVLYMNDNFRSLFGMRGKKNDTLTDVFAEIRLSFRDPHATIDGLLEMLGARRKTTDLTLTLKNDAKVHCDYIPLTVDGQHRGHLFICREKPDIFSDA